MRFSDLLLYDENIFIKEINKCIESHIDTFIWGAGRGARNVKNRIEASTNLSIVGFVVNREFFSNYSDVLCLEEVIKTNKVNLIVAFAGFDAEKYKGILERVNILITLDSFTGNGDVGCELIDRAWIKNNSERLERVYHTLKDNYSRYTYVEFINQKLAMYTDNAFISSKSQYLDDEIIQFANHEVIVDCGGFTGDSAEQIYAIFMKNNLEYDEIISFEPDDKNYELMVKRNIPRHTCIKKGCSNKIGILYFENNGSCTTLKEDGGCSISVDSIDNILGGESKNKAVTFIKMDIEGSELAALQGAKKIIKRDKPKLAICIYHKRDDLIDIPEYIMSLHSDYKLYIRLYGKHAQELVLYAV